MCFETLKYHRIPPWGLWGANLHIPGPFSSLPGCLFIVAELVCCPVATGAAECGGGGDLDAPPALQISSGYLKNTI